MSDTLKANFLKRVDAWPEEDAEVRGQTVRIQALNRDEAMKVSTFEDPGEREAYMISCAIIAPFELTEKEAQQLRVVSEPLDLEAFTEQIVRLSGMDKESREAKNRAFKSVRDESGSGV